MNLSLKHSCVANYGFPVCADLPISGGQWCMSDRVTAGRTGTSVAEDAESLPGQTEGK